MEDEYSQAELRRQQEEAKKLRLQVFYSDLSTVEVRHNEKFRTKNLHDLFLSFMKVCRLCLCAESVSSSFTVNLKQKVLVQICGWGRGGGVA